MKRVLCALFLGALLFTSCGGDGTEKRDGLVEVIYFQQDGNIGNAIESLTQQVLEDEFAEQLEDEDVLFMTVDISTEEGQLIADGCVDKAPAIVLYKWKDGEKEVINFTTFARSTVIKSPDKYKTVIGIKMRELLKK